MKKTELILFIFLLSVLAAYSVSENNYERPALKIKGIEGTALFKNTKDGLKQAADITIENNGIPLAALLKIRSSLCREMVVDLGIIKTGEGTYRTFIPEITDTVQVTFILEALKKKEDVLVKRWIPGKHWEICMVPISHHDLGYTNLIERVIQQYNEVYEDVIRFCEETDNYPDEAKFRYSVEQSWSLQHFIRSSDRETHARLAKYIQEGRIEVPAFFGNMISDLCSHEELVRLMYPSFRIKREFGGDIKMAGITDIPGMSWGIPTVLAGAGVKYFFAGLPDYFEWYKNRLPGMHSFWDEKNILRPHGKPDAFYWKGPDGSKVLVYYQGSYGCWSPKSCDQIMNELPGMLNEMDGRGNPFTVMRYGFGCSDNSKTTLNVCNLVREWNREWAFPRLIVATNTLFFEKFEKQCKNLRTFNGDLPHTDYSVGASSSAKENAVNRVAHDRIQSAEKLATLSNLLLNTVYPTDDLTDAWDNTMLFDEHTWGMWDPVGEVQDWAWNEKSKYAYKAAGIAEMILSGRRGYAGGGPLSLANSVSYMNEGPHIVIFNSLAFKRNDIVTVSCFHPEEPFRIVDTETGKSIPYQVVRIDSPYSPIPFAAGRYARGRFNATDWFDKAPADYNLVFFAENVPPMGYKTYRIVPGLNHVNFPENLMHTDNGLENRFYRISINQVTGTISGIFDKELGIELLDKNAFHRGNQLIARWAVTGKEESPELATISKGQTGPVYASILVSSNTAGCPQISQEIILYDKIKRIDINNRLLKDMAPAMEIYFAFPFQMEQPDFRFESPLSVIQPLKDQFPGSNTNYYSVQHWVNVTDGKAGITLTPVDAHLMMFGGLNTSKVSQAHHGITPVSFLTPFISELKKGFMYSYVLNSNFCTNFQTTQQGDLLFRYAITSHKGNHIAGCPRDFGWSVKNPLIAVPTSGKMTGILPESLSFCQTDQPNVIILALKKAENEKGFILRLNETEGRETSVNITFPMIIATQVNETNLIELDAHPVKFDEHSFSTTIKPFGIRTFRIISETEKRIN